MISPLNYLKATAPAGTPGTGIVITNNHGKVEYGSIPPAIGVTNVSGTWGYTESGNSFTSYN